MGLSPQIGWVYGEDQILAILMKLVQDHICLIVRNRAYSHPECYITHLSRYAASVSPLHKYRRTLANNSVPSGIDLKATGP